MPIASLDWAPRPAETALAAAGGLAMTALGFTVDPTGRWLVWAAAALLLGIAAVDVLIRPRLRADSTGLTVRSLTGRRVARWAEIELSLRRLPRFGRSVPTLELELDGDLIVLGRRELGADPELVVQQLEAIRADL
ncbi:MAG: PH domain-containing protein [Actinomycetota bacterium]|nr:PH domain-containing protein [Actinomycetota bacterium]